MLSRFECSVTSLVAVVHFDGQINYTDFVVVRCVLWSSKCTKSIFGPRTLLGSLWRSPRLPSQLGGIPIPFSSMPLVPRTVSRYSWISPRFAVTLYLCFVAVSLYIVLACLTATNWCMNERVWIRNLQYSRIISLSYIDIKHRSVNRQSVNFIWWQNKWN